MVYLSDKVSGSGDMTMRRCTSESDSQIKMTCVDCGTSKTPLWRSGPAGPKSLCNACGIKSRKKRRPSPSDKISKKNKIETTTVNCKSVKEDNSDSSDKEECKSSKGEEGVYKNEMEKMVKRIKMVLNGDVPSGASDDEANSSGCDFGEEERAAILLMGLSYGILSS